jgi:hypothetical protein
MLEHTDFCMKGDGMRKTCLTLIAVVLALGRANAMDLNMDWAYHDDNSGVDDRAGEGVPGQAFTFLGNGKLEIPDADPVTLYVLTANQFAGEGDEQVFVRWWNGTEEKWIQGGWETNVFLGSGENDAGRFHGQPAEASVMLDIWKVVIPADVTSPGDNYYVIQLKGVAGEESAQNYLLRDSAGDTSKNNNVGQSWTSGDYFGHDWSVKIVP